MIWLLACSALPEPPPPDDRVTIAELGLELRVPAGHRMSSLTEPVPTTKLELRPGQRTSRTIRIALDTEDRPELRDVPGCPWSEGQVRHTEEHHWIYRISVGCGGPGGTEAWLHATWHFEGQSFQVRCNTQDELFLGEPDPTWCLSSLETARAVVSE
ncbi:MAG: hypothetical protein GY913_35930 [Proteobacteria bacterium]|nr:hypothetical protein [Pseudomonadota bacterium]MCP4922321.1 hypothetical protein [Pseudomonadota bacterium]